jgi:hypothetical protein
MMRVAPLLISFPQAAQVRDGKIVQQVAFSGWDANDVHFARLRIQPPYASRRHFPEACAVRPLLFFEPVREHAQSVQVARLVRRGPHECPLAF